ncbi:MAG: ATP synthase subunit I [Gammaproteobacteria bacterium]
MAVVTEAIQEFTVPTPGKQPILSILLAQALVGGLVASGLALWLGSTAGFSALMGGVAAVLPNAFLAALLLTPRAGSSARALLGAAWVGEIGKLMLTVLLFAVVFIAVRPISAPAVFAGYIAAQLVILCAPLMGSERLDGRDGKAKI